MKTFYPWFKFYPRDWLDKTRSLTLEERGAYIDMIAIRMISEGPLPDGDYSWLAHQMHISTRKAKSIVEALVVAKRIDRTEAGLTDNRCEKELAARAHQRQVNVENRAKHLRADLESSAKIADQSVENSKKENEINESHNVWSIEKVDTRARLDSDLEVEKKDSIPPTPLEGGESEEGLFEAEGKPEPGKPPKKSKMPKSAFTADQLTTTDAAVAAWNEIAIALGFSEVRITTTARRTRLLKRLDDIEGLENFRIALSAIKHVPFLMGHTPPKHGSEPFKLDIDRLLQTDGGLGDVLAKLIDKAGETGGDDDPHRNLVGPNGRRWGWWRGKEIASMSLEYWTALDSKLRPNGEWPWWFMGPPPGHEECFVHPELIARKGYAEIYKGQIHHA